LWSQVLHLPYLGSMKLVEMQFGSFVYGTGIPTSDTDIKAVYMPDASDILLQRIRGTIVQNTKINPTDKNTSTDIDIETFALHQYLRLLMEGQTVALDMLFTPHSFHLKRAHPAWQDIWANRERFLHKGVSAFVGYTKQQAAKYGIKGSRVAATRKTLEFLKSLPDQGKKLGHYKAEILEWIQTVDSFDLSLGGHLIKVSQLPNRVGAMEDYLDVCNRKVPFHASTKFAVEQMQDLFDRYGERARAAESNQGVDWKALMHAVRVAHEARELLITANITFPRPEASLLLQIRKGELPYKQVAEIIENGLVSLAESQKASRLREAPDRDFADNLVLSWYGEHVASSVNLLSSLRTNP
jgi:hypothetical protein